MGTPKQEAAGERNRRIFSIKGAISLLRIAAHQLQSGSATLDTIKTLETNLLSLNDKRWEQKKETLNAKNN